MRLTLEGDASANAPMELGEAEEEPVGSTGIETEPAGVNTGASGETDTLDALALAPLHLRLTQVTLQDQTDGHNELISENEWLLHPSEEPLLLSGCLFSVEDVLTGVGLIFLKEAPLPQARPVPSPHDLRVRLGDRRSTLAGHGADLTGEGYTFVTLAYTGGPAGRSTAL